MQHCAYHFIYSLLTLPSPFFLPYVNSGYVSEFLYMGKIQLWNFGLMWVSSCTKGTWKVSLSLIFRFVTIWQFLSFRLSTKTFKIKELLAYCCCHLLSVFLYLEQFPSLCWEKNKIYFPVSVKRLLMLDTVSI